MLKVTSEYIRLASFFDEIDDVDWGEDADPRDPRTNRPVNEDNLHEYLVDEVEKEEPHQEQEDQYNYQYPAQSVSPDSYLDEMPNVNPTYGLPEESQEIPYDTSQNPERTARQLVYDGIDNAEIIGFEYTNRFGSYAGWRVLEPHYTFYAQSTGNEVLVGFDRGRNDIRAFIVGNIMDKGVRYQDAHFDPRPEIMRGVA